MLAQRTRVVVAAAVGGLWWLVFHRYHRWTTWFLGVIPFAVVLGGLGSLLVVALWLRLFPQLAAVDALRPDQREAVDAHATEQRPALAAWIAARTCRSAPTTASR